MTPEAIGELKRQIESEIAAFEEKKRVLEAIELVSAEMKKRGLSNEGPGQDNLHSNGSRSATLVTLFNSRSGYGDNTRRVVAAVRQINGAFDVNKLFSLLDSKNLTLQKPEIATVLTKLRKRGDISVLKEGRGRAATIYVPAKLAEVG